MGQDPNQQYPNQYGQPGNPQPQGGYPPQSGNYPPPSGSYPPPSQPGGYPPQSGGYPPQSGGYPPPSQPGGYPPPSQPGGYPPSGPGYQYQQPGTQYNVGVNTGVSSSNMDPNVAAGLSYILGWVTGLIFFLIEKQNRFVRFNAMQSIVLTGAATIASIVLTVASGVLAAISIFGCLFGLVQLAVGVGFLVFWIICLVNAFQGKFYKIPVLGDYAERWAGSTGTPPTYS